MPGKKRPNFFHSTSDSSLSNSSATVGLSESLGLSINKKQETLHKTKYTEKIHSKIKWTQFAR